LEPTSKSSTLTTAFEPINAWINAFFEYDWKKAFPDPDVALKQIRQLLEIEK
jgi:hypothetical protein